MYTIHTHTHTAKDILFTYLKLNVKVHKWVYLYVGNKSVCVCVCTRYASCSNSIFENDVIIMNSILYTPTLQPCLTVTACMCTV